MTLYALQMTRWVNGAEVADDTAAGCMDGAMRFWREQDASPASSTQTAE